MNKPQNSSFLQDAIKKAKSILPAVYLLILSNVILFIGLVIQDLSLVYLVGSLTVIIGFVTIIAQSSGVIRLPSPFFSENFQTRVKNLSEKTLQYLKSLHASDLEQKSTTTILAILMIIYTSSILNGTLEIFILFNLAYTLVFLQQQIKECSNCCSCDCLKGFLSKIRYQQ